MSKDNGGPAFPTDEYYDEKRFGQTPGMTLRDYFAGKAFQVRLTQAEVRGWSLTEVCDQAWVDAAAMLAARAK